MDQIGITKAIVQQCFNTKWTDDLHGIHAEGKLDLFSKLIGEFGLSEYIGFIKNPKHRIAMTRMRVSAHKLPIETGRYYKISRELRECPLGCKTLGDEAHYMTSCEHPFIRELINPTLAKIESLNVAFGQMDTKDKTIYMLSTKDHRVLPTIAKFCYKLQELFKDMTFNGT